MVFNAKEKNRPYLSNMVVIIRALGGQPGEDVLFYEPPVLPDSDAGNAIVASFTYVFVHPRGRDPQDLRDVTNREQAIFADCRIHVPPLAIGPFRNPKALVLCFALVVGI